MKLPYAKNPTSCKACRTSKRKCDLSALEKGPCSNCVMRNIGNSCQIEGNTANIDHIKKPRAKKSPQSSESSKSSPSVKGASEGVILPSQLPFNVFVSLPPKLLGSCVLRFLGSKEWTFFLDPEVLMRAVMDLMVSIVNDPEVLSLLYSLCACMIVRRGASVVKSVGYTGSRADLAEEMFSIHLRISQYQVQTFHSIRGVQALIMRGHCYLHREKTDDGWKALYQAIAGFNTLVPPVDDDEQLEYDKTWLAMCILESALCTCSDKRPVLLPQREHSLRFEQWSLQRRWNVLRLGKEVQCVMDRFSEVVSKSEDVRNDFEFALKLINREQELVETQVLQFIEEIDRNEGIITPYGQLLLTIHLIKLHTQKMLKLGVISKNFGSVNDSNGQQVKQIAIDIENHKKKSTKLLTKYGNSMIGYLEDLAKNCSRPVLGSAPTVATKVFQGLTCIWIQSVMCIGKNPEFFKRFEEIKLRTLFLLNGIREDTKICKRTNILFSGLDVLSKIQFNEDAEQIQIPIPPALCTGIEAITKTWNDLNKGKPFQSNQASITYNSSSVVDRSQFDTTSFFQFNPISDESLFWSFLSSSTDFDESIKFVENATEDFVLQ